MSDFNIDNFDPLSGATQETIRRYMRKKHARILGAIEDATGTGIAAEMNGDAPEASDTPEPPAKSEQPTQQQRVRQAIMARQQVAPATRKDDDVAPSVPVEVGMWSAAQPGLTAGRNAMLAAAGVEATARPSDVAGRVLDEKSKVAEYVARKRGLALAEKSADNTAERTAAYSEATRANAERAQAQLEASQAKAALDAELRRRNADTEEAKAAETARHNQAMEAAKAHRGGPNPAAAEKAKAALRKDVGGLRKEFNALPEVKSFKEATTSFEKIKSAAANPSAAGDLSLIFAYMKVLDPGSTVREGEFATAEQAAGVPQQILNQYNKVLSGERLSQGQRGDFIAQATKLYDAQRVNYAKAAKLYRGLAEKEGGDPNDVTGAEDSASQTGGEATQVTGGDVKMVGGRRYRKTAAGWQAE